MKDKLTSRKFWLTVALVLGGIASVISGACTDNNTLILIGSICAALSAVLYQICETVIDTAAVGLDETIADDSVLEDEIENEEGDGTVG